ncbi:DUF1080 domain-containing protein [Cyclobacterium sp.]|uniref:3-keto-disaccharide hydrolase n=1 Tax=Cyclobacterium sp. TaxID=1966343 RepID=UPI0019A2BC80|nr:DUF1080 domain-containing protein [Cyclobacterium sp.]MBD3627768.1 DUF1080 domain-containing protein [Cyclobacterium sp.]
MIKFISFKQIGRWLSAGFFIFSLQVQAQELFSFDSFDRFEKPGKSWAIVGDVQADIHQTGQLAVEKGQGILANIPTQKNKGEDLFTKASFGDMDLEVDYLVAKGSNSGIYLQGMYEIQILDSWGKAIPSSGDNGGIYERWDDSKPDGQQGYQGYAPRQNASKAPGLWQNLKVSFQAARFDAQNNKIENAKILSVVLNGVKIHEDVELFGPTRGAMAAKEMARGPIRIQGDHGAVAFRNLKITAYDKALPGIKDITYDLYKGRFEEVPDFSKFTPERSGQMEKLTANIRGADEQFLIRYKAFLELENDGMLKFNLSAPGGAGALSVGDEQVIAASMGNLSGELQLTAGKHPVEILYAKVQDWVQPGIGLEVSGPGIRPVQLSDKTFTSSSGPDPILVDPKERPVLRSFMDIPDGHRVTHAVSVGSPYKVHYTYDMDQGNLVQVWKGGFLNATPMWNSRGDGSSRPMGAITRFGTPALPIARLQSLEQSWPVDTLGTGYKVHGYKILSNDHHLQFMFEGFGAEVADELEILADGKGLKRILTIKNARESTYVRLAKGEQIVDLGEGLFVIGDKSYYLQLEDPDQFKPEIRSIDGMMELLIPARENMAYFLLF